MKDALAYDAAETAGEARSAQRLSLSLLGFERSQEYLLVAFPDEEPFLRLQSLADPNLGFLVIEPAYVHPEYEPDINIRDARHLELKDSDDAFLLNIVTLHGPGRATANLKGPIVINRRTGRGKQTIPDNAWEYTLQHSLPVES